MQHKSNPFLLITPGMVILIAIGVFLATATPASAQCGSQASSCKNCHEVQGQKPVNSDGTGWHQSHAFGDFCYICHAGNNQAKDKTAAHTGMVNPLSDVKIACQQCHVSDYEARAQVYATTLGVNIGSGSATPASGTPEAAPVSATPVAISSAASNQNCNEMVVNDPNIVNYAQNYDEIVLGKKPVNWGNMILIGMIGLISVGGGGFVVAREKLISVSYGDTCKVEGEYPAEVVAMLPKIAGLKADARKSLKHVLDNSKKAEKVLALMEAVMSEKKDEE